MIKLNRVWIASILWFMTQLVFADDPVLHSLSQPFPPHTEATGGTVTSTYTFTNNLPSTFKNNFAVYYSICPFSGESCTATAAEFTINDQCTGKKLRPNEHCSYSVSLKPLTTGRKTIMISYGGYDYNVVNVVPALTTFTSKKSNVFIVGHLITSLPPTMIPNESASYVFEFKNEGSQAATNITVSSTAPNSTSSCATQLNPGSTCILQGNYSATNPPPTTQTVLGTFNFTEGQPVSVQTQTQVSVPTSGIIGTVSPPLGQPLPSYTLENTDYTVIFSFTNYEPNVITFTETTTFPNFIVPLGGDTCVPPGTLAHLASCTITGTFNSATPGPFALSAQLIGTVSSNVATTSTTVVSDNIKGSAGVDYDPSHYAVNNSGIGYFNGHNVFYTSADKTNIYAELQQLKTAGFTSIRAYETSPYTWIEIINQAHLLGMKVIYEANIPCANAPLCTGNADSIKQAVTLLKNLITDVTPTVFGNTVTLVFAGHENFNENDLSYLQQAIKDLQNALSTNGLGNIPVGSALISPDLTNPPPRISKLIASYSANAPLAFDPYPMQWGVPIANAVNDSNQIQSISNDYLKVKAQSFYTPGRTILMAETGWPGAFSAPPPPYSYPTGYSCTGWPAAIGPCEPRVANEKSYFPEIYDFVNISTNNAAVLSFLAYDQPAKGINLAGIYDPNSVEIYYGLFDSTCTSKGAALVPNNISVSGGCSGYEAGGIIIVNGLTGSIFPPTQPSFNVQITHPAINVNVPSNTGDNQSYFPWPHFLVYNSSTSTKTKLTITGSTIPITICSVDVSVAVPTGNNINNTVIFDSETMSCNRGNVPNCTTNPDGSGQCYLPNPF
jgi:hypothetical protein